VKVLMRTAAPEIDVDKLLGENPDSKKITIQILRAGKFKHPSYGEIKFDDKVFDSFVRNFKEKVPQERIAFDFKHKPDWGAACWIEDLHLGDDGKFYADVELTPRGHQSLKDKEFVYFSTEYSDNYEDRETGKKYGPTILGGGLTNRPFIKGMAPVLLSEDGTESPFVEADDYNSGKEDLLQMEEIRKALEALQAQMKKLEEEHKDNDQVTAALEAFGTQMKSLEEKVEALKDDDGKDDENLKVETEKLSEEIEGLRKTLAEMVDTDDSGNAVKKLAEENKKLAEDMKKLSDDNDKLGNTVKSLMEKNEEKDKDLYKQSVAAFCKELEEDSHYPATVKEVNAILSAYDSGESIVVTLSEETGEGDAKKTVETKLDLPGIIKRVLASIPEEARVALEEGTEGPKGKLGDNKKLSVADIEKLAKDENITFRDMLLKLSSDEKTKNLIDV